MPPTHHPMDIARAEAIEELAVAILRSATKVIKAHGPDPHVDALLATAVVLAVREMGKGNPAIPRAIANELERMERPHA